MGEMDIQIQRLSEGNLVEVALNGRLDANSSEVVKVELHNVIATVDSYIIVNLKDVYFIDSSGLSSLVSGLRAAREKNADIILTNLNSQANMVFKLTMLDKIFNIFPNRKSALESIQKQTTSSDTST